MRTRSFALTCLSIIALATSDAKAFPVARGAAVIARAVGDCGNPCTVQSNNGGLIVDFESAGNAIRAGARKKLVVDGFCASACMVMADRARPRACITSRAQFAYHKTNFNRPIPLRADLHGWIMQHGGFPAFRSTPGMMPNEVAQRFWPLCTEAKLAGNLVVGTMP
jgi:hypothetical protein